MRLFVGLDGCRGGWVAAMIRQTDHRLELVQLLLLGSLSELLSFEDISYPILIDIPIGLPTTGKRGCDGEARKLLTRSRGSSVFPVPSRRAIYAPTYEEACTINLQDQGVKLSKQTWNIRNKILETDAFLQENIHFKGKLRECHPELAFWGLNGGKPMVYNKKTDEGRMERKNMLENYVFNVTDLMRSALSIYSRTKVSEDDVFDAIVLSILASQATTLQSLPQKAEWDEWSISMEIVYVKDGGK